MNIARNTETRLDQHTSPVAAIQLLDNSRDMRRHEHQKPSYLMLILTSKTVTHTNERHHTLYLTVYNIYNILCKIRNKVE